MQISFTKPYLQNQFQNKVARQFLLLMPRKDGRRDVLFPSYHFLPHPRLRSLPPTFHPFYLFVCTFPSTFCVATSSCCYGCHGYYGSYGSLDDAGNDVIIIRRCAIYRPLTAFDAIYLRQKANTSSHLVAFTAPLFPVLFPILNFSYTLTSFFPFPRFIFLLLICFSLLLIFTVMSSVFPSI